MRPFLILVLAVLVMMDCQPIQAACTLDPTYVLSSDIPLIEGLSLEEDTETIFDVPEGKIIEINAFGPVDLKEAQQFYKEALAALGWHPIPQKKWHYKRGDELLELSFEDGEDDLQIKFRLMPSPYKAGALSVKIHSPQ